MEIFEYGNKQSDFVLIQPVGDHDAGFTEKVVAEIKRISGKDFMMAAFKVNDWNKELSPWEAPPVFGNEGFGAGADMVETFYQTQTPDRHREGGFTVHVDRERHGEENFRTHDEKEQHQRGACHVVALEIRGVFESE